MKKPVLVVILLLLLSSTAWCVEDAFNLRGVALGMNRQQVAKIETGTPANDENTLDMMLLYTLNEPVFGLDEAKAYYYFTNAELSQSLNLEEDRLYAMGLMFKPYVMDDVKALDDYKELVKKLEAQYGAPVFYGIMENGELTYTCSDDNYVGMTHSFADVLVGRAFWA